MPDQGTPPTPARSLSLRAGRVPAARRIQADRAAGATMIAAAAFLVVVLVAVYVFMAGRAFLVFGHTSPWTFFLTDNWKPLGAQLGGQPSYGAFGIIAGSLMVVGLAVLLATPVSLGAALFIEQTDPRIGDRLLRPAIEIFVGIPSVVYGWVGLTVLVPWIRTHTTSPAGFSVIGAAFVLAVMILPTVTSLAADAIRRVPEALAEASYALGATRWQTIWRVVLSAARPGITSGIVLGVARALGEALAVAMVIGGVPHLPQDLLHPAATMTTVIALELPNGALNPVLNDALYTLGLFLLVLSLVAIIVIRRFSGGFTVRQTAFARGSGLGVALNPPEAKR